MSLASSVYDLINSSAHLPTKDFLAFNYIGGLCFSIVLLVLFPEPVGDSFYLSLLLAMVALGRVKKP